MKQRLPYIIVAILVALLLVAGYLLVQQDSTSDAERERLEERTQELVRELQTHETRVDTVRDIIRSLEISTNTRDAPPGPPGPAGPPGGTNINPDPVRPPATANPIDPFPHPDPSAGTLKPVLCALAPNTMAFIGVDCGRDTYVMCDLTGLNCPPPALPEPTTPASP